MNKKAAKQSIIDSYFLRTEEAERCRENETGAAIMIQKVFRGYSTRKHLQTLHGRALIIQCAFRVYCAKKVYNKLYAEKCHRERLQHFNAAAQKIQTLFRGWYIRKYVCNIRKRREYLQNIQSKNEEVRQMLEEYQKQQLVQIKEQAELDHHNSVVASSRNLHHLTSTKTMPSIFNSPYQVAEPKVEGVNVETFIKTQTRRILKARTNK
ncbi:putative iq calmodulin-binding motif family protein [Blattamonas nauphoetae]|uniref:Iq calmodulin-binding motif family protein n=1 Tax=Blattamonas nauphoetae TaxID=2049346 RepID=A0ABQ9XWI1_9EUKA|nr:putative iq calmodulin-binding motif family protein [Blattamonas nauphoetae]